MSDLPSSFTLIAEEVEEISKGSKWWLRFFKITLPVKYYFQSWQNISFGKRKNAVYCSQLLEHHEKSRPSLNWFMLAVGSLQLESVLPKSHSHPSVVSFHHWQSIPLVLYSGVLERHCPWKCGLAIFNLFLRFCEKTILQREKTIVLKRFIYLCAVIVNMFPFISVSSVTVLSLFYGFLDVFQ